MLPVRRQVEVDIFSRAEYKHIILESLRYCQKEKGLNVYAYVIMSNHIHLIASAEEGYELSNILRDFKKFTAKQILKRVQNGVESRKECLPAAATVYTQNVTG